MTPHDIFLKEVESEFILNNFFVEKEVQIPYGKGAVDILAWNDNYNFYLEIKSKPQSIHSKKVQKQLTRYKEYFGDEHIYCLVSPDAKGNPRICSLDSAINCSLEHCFSKI